MAQEASVSINFKKGVDTKTDPWQVPIGNFLSLVNSVFTTGDLLVKRNGYGLVPGVVPESSYLATLNDTLLSVGSSINAYSPSTQSWVTKGTLQPASLSVMPLVRNNLNQTQSDSVVASNGLVCTVYTENNGSSNSFKYVVADSVTGQNVVSPTAISANATYGFPKVFWLGNYFIVVYSKLVSGNYQLVYVAISVNNPSVVRSEQIISTSYTPSTTVAFDGVVTSNGLYLAWNGGASSGIKMAYLSSILTVSSNVIKDAAHSATLMSVTAQDDAGVIWVTYYDSGTSNAYTLAVNTMLSTILAATAVFTAAAANLTSVASGGVMTLFYEVTNVYSYDIAIPSNLVRKVSVTQAGTVGSNTESARSVGLASKAFLSGGSPYYLVSFQSPFQPSYFLINGSTSISSSPIIVAKLAYQNGGGYLTHGLPNVSLNNGVAQIAYLFKQSVQALNTVNNTQQTTTGGIYSQLGVNLVSIEIGTNNIGSSEIGRNLHISGGYLGMFDGFYPVEHNFFLFPDSVECVWSATGGSMYAKPDGSTNTSAYYYQVTYEWTDMQGNAFRSAPSIPVAVTTTGSATTGSVTVNVPTLRLTSKINTPVKIVIYRWSVLTQVYNQVTSISAPTLNSTTSDSIAYVDVAPDNVVTGNNILYTTGGVIPDTNGPASNIMTIFDTRLCLVDAEDPNVLWVSKTVVEGVPVEMCSAFKIFVAPNIGTTGSSGPMTAAAPMDDKIILFKKNSIFYINGAGPDNLGTTSPGCPLGTYSQPTFITSVVGSTNQQSIVLTQDGLMFQSDKGIWRLGRDLSTTYIGAPVEAFNQSVVTSANVIPSTNYVLFTLNTGEMLMYDYYYGQWGTFMGVPTVSSCIYNNLHTVLDQYGQILQETRGLYLDGSNPVLMSFTTSWLNLASLQGYERFYEFYILAKYLSPHMLIAKVAYNYNPSVFHSSTIRPLNFSPSTPSSFGIPTPVGAPLDLEQWRIHAKQQLCQSFQLSIQEVFDPQFGTVPGAGFTMSGLNCKVGIKKARRPIRGANTVG